MLMKYPCSSSSSTVSVMYVPTTKKVILTILRDEFADSIDKSDQDLLLQRWLEARGVSADTITKLLES